MQQIERSVAALSIVLLSALAVEQANPQTPPAWDWPIAKPEEQGLDAQKLSGLIESIRKGELCPQLDALVVVRHGSLVVEEYFNGWEAGRVHTLQSVTKSVTSALVGIALARGEFKGLDEKVLDFFPDMKEIANRDERKEAMRLEDLLTMRTGVDFHESGPNSPLEMLNKRATGWDKFYLDRPMLDPPGTKFNYDSGAAVLLSAMLKNRTGMHALQYAERHLFQPLGIEKKFWVANAEGHTHTGGGLLLTARDAARFGLLYLNNGRWGDVQVVPEDWVRKSLSMQVDLTAPGQPPSGYGYLWWIGAPDWQGNGREYVPFARGRFGQYIFVVPEHDMVVVILGDAKTGEESSRPIQVFYDRVLDAVRRPAAAASAHDAASPAAAAIERHVAWLGGWERLAGLQDITQSGKLSASGLSGTIAARSRRDGYMRATYDLMVLEGGTTVTPAEAYSLSPSGQPEPLGQHEAEEERRALARAFGLHLQGEGTAITHQGMLERAGRSWEDVRFTYPNGDEFDLLLDPADGGLEWQRSRVDNEESWIHLTEWREVEGLRFPFRQETSMSNPAENQLIQWEGIEINTHLADALFDPPLPVKKPVRIAQGTATDWSPVDLFRHRYLYLRGRVNGVETDLLLDSGAGMTVLDRAFADTLGLEAAGELAAEGAGGNTTAAIVSGVRIEAAGLLADSLSVVVIDLASTGRMLGRPLPVIFGKEVFNNLIVDLDYPNARIRFLDPATFHYEGPGQKAPLFPMEGGHREIEAAIENLGPARFHLDTGSGGTLEVYGAYAEEHRLLDGRSPISEHLGGGVGGRTTSKATTLRSFTIAGFVLENVPATFSGLGAGSEGTRRQAGRLGAGILSRFRVLFDYPSECLYLEPGQGWDDGAFRRERSGLALELAGDTLQVVFVAPGSPAEETGWKIGDRIVAVDGESIDPVRYWKETGEWNYAQAGREVTLTLAGGETRRLTLRNYY